MRSASSPARPTTAPPSSSSRRSTARRTWPGKTLATPQLGGTQDVALRKWLLDNGLKVQTTGGADVDIVNQENSQTLDLFKTGEIDGAWLPEPWASRLVLEAGGKTLLDEKTLWPDEEFQTTILISSRQFLEDHPETIEALIKGEIAADRGDRGRPGHRADRAQCRDR